MKDRIRELLEGVRSGSVNIDEAFQKLKDLPFEDIGFAVVDHHRTIRRGFPEVIFCQGKTPDQVVAIGKRLVGEGNILLATRADEIVAEKLKKEFPEAEHNPMAKTVIVRPEGKESWKYEGKGTVLIVSAGTSDIPIAEEAAVTAEVMGNRVERLFDVGVAGIHRLLAHREKLLSASVIVVVAGMEGALASVVSGLVDVPVIGVPTSIGYGASFGGIAALLGMLNSCSAGVTVVNIDNGFGAGYAASLVNRKS